MIHIDIQRLVQQRDPILMVDELLQADGQEAITRFSVCEGNIFLAADGRMEETGLLEHIAQSASALAGYRALQAGATEPPRGFIGEIKKFRCLARPAVGDLLTTHITLGAEVEGVTLLTGETRVGDTLMATTQMKIFIP
jgi:predicted hotdog family 3-hydroxylacyl-ACP dehydratase